MDTRIETDKLVIKPTNFKDCILFEKWESQNFIKQFLAIDDWRDYREIVTEFILRTQDITKMQFTILLKEDNLPIGRIYISRFDIHEGSIDITRIYIGEEACLRKGYGREAMKGLLKFFFKDLLLERVTIDFFEDNIRAKNLYSSLNFKSEGVARNVVKKNNEYLNLHVMSILRDEYLSSIKQVMK